MSRLIHLIVNPKGGTLDNRALAQRAQEHFKSRKIQVSSTFTAHKGHARTIAQSIPVQSETMICGLGGDGTIHEIINGNMQRPETERMPIAILPGGTGNSFLDDLGLLHFEKALNQVCLFQVRPVDLLRVRLDNQLCYVFNVCGWGLFASGNASAESLRCLKKQRYHVAGIWEIIRNKSQNATLTFANESREGRFSLIVASNTRCVGRAMLISPKASWNDGKLDLTFLKKTNRVSLLRMFLKLPKGTHIQETKINYVQTKSYTIQSPHPSLWNLDGEVYSGSKGDIEIRPGAVQICM